MSAPSKSRGNTLAATPSRSLDLSGPIVVGVDTETHVAETLTVQAAVRLDDRTIAVQVYSSPAIPRLPRDFDYREFLPEDAYRRYFDTAVLRRRRVLKPYLSPTRLLRHLLDRRDLKGLSRRKGRDLVHRHGPCPGPGPAGNVAWCPRSHAWRVPTIELRLVAHFLRADLLRLFGSDFLASLLADPGQGERRVGFREGKLLGFREPGPRVQARGPLVGYLREGREALYEVRLTTRDTTLPFDGGSLDDLSRALLGVPKSAALDEAEKADMKATFRRRPRDAYGYAIVDAVNALLVWEAMERQHPKVYRALGFPDDAIPEPRPTAGARVAQLLFDATRRHAEGSRQLAAKSALERQMARGGARLFEDEPNASHFGAQTGEVQGGLLYSRSPTRLWHEGTGQFRDVDLAGCYNGVLAGMDVYWGKPLIYEPGNRRLDLEEAVALAVRHADPDGWFVRVTGPIAAGPNALIPSTRDAITTETYRARRRRSSRPGPGGEPAAAGRREDSGRTRLYTGVVESGIVTDATWRMIRALPSPLRREYEALRAESIVLYPRQLAARTGPEFDGLVARLGSEGLPWEAELDLKGLRVVTTERIDAACVMLRFPVRDLAAKVGELRAAARRDAGKGGVLDRAWKTIANTMYGVVSSPHMVTSNFVAGNVITARVRAASFALFQSLNGVQVITDGATYRRDQIPATTFAACLGRCPDYPIRRADVDSGVPFLDPDSIPEGEGFTAWFRGHARRFFEADGAELDGLFEGMVLEHKATGSTAFDALAVDGCANYVKCTRGPDSGWRVADFKARSYGRESKKVIGDWLVGAYSTDKIEGPPPVAEDRVLLGLDEARAKARSALSQGATRVFLPLGLRARKVVNYKLVKASAFLFRTPRQERTIRRAFAKFEEKTGCGLELLALRRSYDGRRAGSLEDLAEALYDFIRGGGSDLAKALNLSRLTRRMRAASHARLAELDTRRREAREALHAAIDLDGPGVDAAAILTGLIVSADQAGVLDRGR